ncbi:MAG: hypothetical protein INR66_16585 [Gordonia polyisoprenivorans]|nr:hypothetical protein [Gordonia polyisoprenivorans]
MPGSQTLPSPPDIERSARWLSQDVRRATRDDPLEVQRRARRRLTDVVRHAKANSPVFADLYASLPPTAEIAEFPTTDKSMLMAAFDEWSCDRRITGEAAERFSSSERVGERFLGEYLYSESSGTTGLRGRFVTEDRALAVLHALRSRIPSPSAMALARLVAKRGRSAAIINLQGHHLGSAYYRRVEGEPRQNRRVLSVTDPVSEIATQLSELDPATISSYGSVLSLLAERQLAGLVDIDPVVLVPFSETVTGAARRRLHQAWPRTTIVERYVANECMFISARCDHGSHHLNADWVILEPIDSVGRPVPPGVESDTVLLTTLFRRVQPIIRYDLGDRVRFHEQRCPCGNQLPAFDVLGRSGGLLTFPTRHGPRTISPTVLTVVLDELADAATSQLLVDTDEHVTIHLTTHHDADQAHTAAAAHTAVRSAFHAANITTVTVDVTLGSPIRTPGGKLSRIVDRRDT